MAEQPPGVPGSMTLEEFKGRPVDQRAVIYAALATAVMVDVETVSPDEFRLLGYGTSHDADARDYLDTQGAGAALDLGTLSGFLEDQGYGSGMTKETPVGDRLAIMKALPEDHPWSLINGMGGAAFTEDLQIPVTTVAILALIYGGAGVAGATTGIGGTARGALGAGQGLGALSNTVGTIAGPVILVASKILGRLPSEWIPHVAKALKVIAAGGFATGSTVGHYSVWDSIANTDEVVQAQADAVVEGREDLEQYPKDAPGGDASSAKRTGEALFPEATANRTMFGGPGNQALGAPPQAQEEEEEVVEEVVEIPEEPELREDITFTTGFTPGAPSPIVAQDFEADPNPDDPTLGVPWDYEAFVISKYAPGLNRLGDLVDKGIITGDEAEALAERFQPSGFRTPKAGTRTVINPATGMPMVDPATGENVIESGYGNYRVSDYDRIMERMTTPQTHAFQLQAIRAGLIDPDAKADGTSFVPGFMDPATSRALEHILITSNKEGEPWKDTLFAMAEAGDEIRQAAEEDERLARFKNRQPFTGRSYFAPDYAELAQRAKGAVERELGRPINNWEMELLTAQQKADARGQFDQEEAARLAEYNSEGRAILAGEQYAGAGQEFEAIDYVNRFEQTFDETFAAELQRKSRTEKVRESTGSLMAGLNNAIGAIGSGR